MRYYLPEYAPAIQSISKQAVKELHRGQLKRILLEVVNELIVFLI